MKLKHLSFFKQLLPKYFIAPTEIKVEHVKSMDIRWKLMKILYLASKGKSYGFKNILYHDDKGLRSQMALLEVQSQYLE